jgi:NADH-quinone oxidoreductase subunit M
MPWAGGLLVLGALAAMGVPGLAVFVSEAMSIIGGFEAFPVQGVLAALGIVLGAMYLLHMVRRVAFGPIERPALEEVGDAGPTEMAAIVPLALLLVLLGVFPSLIVSVQSPAVEVILTAIGGR